MKAHPKILGLTSEYRSAMTLVEVMVAVAIGSLALAVIMALSIYGLRSFTAIGNYTDLDVKSRAALDEISCDLRECSRLIGYEVSTNTPWFAFTNDAAGTSIRVGWDAASRTVTTVRVDKFNVATTRTNLVECDYWHYDLFQQTPIPNSTNEFNGFQGGGVNTCKLVNMTWRCTRTMLGQKWQTESVQTAKIVLRNAHALP